ncbi:MAG: sulfurtransferase-like selenium metabolism protein YedF [Thermodesulfobacteria bacterium]|nr:sulfurtransferase-like selenium metabolism protein YedF [Thermodesulfobacteriota bacterium]
MQKVDARGLPCPQPVIKTKEALEQVGAGEEVEVLLDNETSLNNVKKFVTAQGHEIVSLDKKDGEFILRIKKTSGTVKKDVPITCELPSSKKEKGHFIIIATDIMGPERELGKILMKAFFETMLVHEMLPSRIFLMNRGVFLSTLEEDFIKLLKELEKKGVEIFTCGTCLKYFNLEDKLKVGHRAGTDVYLEGIFYFDKTVWIG